MRNIIMIGLIAMVSGISAQQKEVTVPFSEPGKAKELKIQVFSGNVKVVGTPRKDVLIKYEVQKNEDNDHKSKDDKSKGMKKIGGGNFQFQIGESNNTVRIESQNFMNLIVMEIEVPSDIDINISKQIGEDIIIDNIQGSINVENNIGSITMTKISGSVNASSSTGEIIVDFDKVSADQAMTFNTITGNIDLTFPAVYKADLKMRTEWGDIYSDMDIETKAVTENESKKVTKNGELKIISNNWTFGSLNGGGPEMTIKTQMGSIYLREKK